MTKLLPNDEQCPICNKAAPRPGRWACERCEKSLSAKDFNKKLAEQQNDAMLEEFAKNFITENKEETSAISLFSTKQS